MMKNILITGIDGFVGSNLKKYFDSTHNLFALSRQQEDISNNCFYCDLLDLNNVLNLIKKLSGKRIDIIIHTASILAKIDNLSSTEVLIENIKIANNVTILSKELKIEYLINLSSTSVYPNIDGIYNEDSRIWPASNTDCMYGLSKFNAENIFSFKLQNIVKYILHLRISMIHSEEMRVERIITIFKKSILRNNELIIHGNGERIINYIEIEDLCEHIFKFVNNPITDIINISSTHISLLNLAKKLIVMYGNKDTKLKFVYGNNTNKFIVNTLKFKNLYE